MNLLFFKNQKGNSLLELAIVLPILITLIYGGIEVSRSLSVMQKLTSLSREAASISYRECTLLAPETSRACVVNIVTHLGNDIQAVLPGAQLVVSIYRKDKVTPAFVRHFTAPVSSDAAYTTRFPETGSASLTVKANSILTHPYHFEELAVAEVFYQHSAILNFVPGASNGEFYDVTIF